MSLAGVHVSDEAVRISIANMSDCESETDEVHQSPKRMKVEKPDLDPQLSVKQLLFNINKAICLRLDNIETKLEKVNYRTKALEEKIEQFTDRLNTTVKMEGVDGSPGNNKSAVIVGLPQGNKANATNGGKVPPTLDGPMQNLGPNVTLITLNSEEDYPNGSWLGDENNPEMRVRVPITPSDLLHIHSNCRSPEKMALTLLDYLFDRETQAISNLSGTGKHGKRQLDPLLIYGIRCHLINRFCISETDWHRIKLNIDSKCRTAFRRKVKGLPLTVKGFRGMPGNRNTMQMIDLEAAGSDDDSLQHSAEGELHISGDHIDLSSAEVSGLTTAQLIQSAGGEIQVLHATPEQVAHLQQTHQIQILQGDQVLGLQGDHLGGENIQVAVSMATGHDGSLQIIGDSGVETIHISPGDHDETEHQQLSEGD